MQKLRRILATTLLLLLCGSGTVLRAAFPSAIDSDVYATAISPNFKTYFCLAGRLQLHLKSGSTTHYAGTFLDYDGHGTYAASANTTNAAAPILVITGLSGSYLFKGDSNFGGSFYSAAATKAPASLSRFGSINFSAATHAENAATYKFILTERTGLPAAPDFEYTGEVTITYDANSRVSGGTTSNTDSHGHAHVGKVFTSGYYSSSYLYFGASINGIPFSLFGTFSGTSFSGYGSSGTGANTRLWVLSGNPPP